MENNGNKGDVKVSQVEIETQIQINKNQTHLANSQKHHVTSFVFDNQLGVVDKKQNYYDGSSKINSLLDKSENSTKYYSDQSDNIKLKDKKCNILLVNNKPNKEFSFGSSSKSNDTQEYYENILPLYIKKDEEGNFIFKKEEKKQINEKMKPGEEKETTQINPKSHNEYKLKEATEIYFENNQNQNTLLEFQQNMKGKAEKKNKIEIDKDFLNFVKYKNSYKIPLLQFITKHENLEELKIAEIKEDNESCNSR